MDLEAIERALRVAALSAGAAVLATLLEAVGVGRRDAPVRCTCGQRMASRGVGAKTIVTLLGEVRFARSTYRCPACAKVRVPGDEALGVVKTGYSPGVRRLVADFASDDPFKRASQKLKSSAELSISRKDCERIAEGVGEDVARWFEAEHGRLRATEPPPPEAPKSIEALYIEVDGTGVPMTPHELEGRKGKQADGRAKTREAKLACVFTQTAFTRKGRPIRDPASTSYIGAIETAAACGWRLYAEAVRRGLFHAKRVIVLSDGAEWIRNLVETHFPNVTHIIDLYHAREHLMTTCRLLFGHDLKQLNRYKQRWWEKLDAGEIEAIVEEACAFLPKDAGAAKDAHAEIAYFDKNKKRMRYADYFENGLFVGSGVIEAGCRTIIGERLKKSGMEWTVRGANAITALRCVIQSGRFEEYWEDKAS